MLFALLQTSSERPTLNQLKRAFRALPHLRDLDAVTSFNDAYGIVWRGLEAQDGQHLQAALAHEEIPVEMVAETDLPALPLGHTLTNMQFTPAGGESIDPLGRVYRLPWDALFLIAAGHIMASPVTRPRRPAEKLVESHPPAEEADQWMADLFMDGGSQRFCIDAERFDFGYLGQRHTSDPAKNLAYLVQDLVQFAPSAGLSRGALQFCNQPDSPHVYPRKSAYLEEIVWLLWLARREPSQPIES